MTDGWLASGGSLADGILGGSACRLRESGAGFHCRGVTAARGRYPIGDMGEADPRTPNAGKWVVVGLLVVSAAMFVVLLPDATGRVLDRLGNVAPVVLVVAALAGVVFLFVLGGRRD